MKKNEQILGTCESYTYNGHGVVKIAGFPLFVKDILVGEEALLVVTMVKKTYGYAKIVELRKTSPHRVQPACPIYQRCGGCQLQHMDAQEQAKFKTEQVEQLMRRVAKIDTEVQPVLTAKDAWNYRNKAQIPVGADGVCGFYRINSNDIVPMEACNIQSVAINNIYQSVKTWIKRSNNADLLRHILIKEARITKEWMVVLITKTADLHDLASLIPLLEEHKVQSLYLNINTREDNVILGEEEILVWGKPTITEYLDDFAFDISVKSFFQVNPEQTHVLYQTALDLCNLQGEEEVIDLYCGVGTISMFLAKRAKHVTGIEIVPIAIENAKKNAERNHITNIDFICSDAGAYAEHLAQEGRKPDVVVVDPPRKGCDTLTIASIAAMQPDKIVYVSCDPSTLARDIERFKAYDYECQIVQPVDMFPQTYHVESVVLMERMAK